MSGAVALVALVAVLGACGGGVPGDFDGRVAAWGEIAPDDYSFGYRRGGMCGQATLEITVRDGEVAETGEATAGCGPRIEDARTIDGIFELLRTAYEDADTVTVEYDPVWGFPTQVRVDQDKDGIDDEWGFGVVDFVAE